ncbi:MAG: hypothetical protein KatS3mg102_2012 [Planctomycetota bacterium]|nr:MAG: hypothetical protein KatS3mg102_2012 [Planctomycetota bacterium]
MLAPRQQAPVLLPAYVDLWSQTSPLPAADPEVSLFLHGKTAAPPDVQVVWRADLDGVFARRDLDGACEILRLLPPSALEACSVPLASVRAWLARMPAPAELADLEGREAATAGRESERAPVRPVLRWAGGGRAGHAVRAARPHRARRHDRGAGPLRGLRPLRLAARAGGACCARSG